MDEAMPEKKEYLKERLEALKEEYSKTKDNKATNKHIGLLRAKIAKTKRELIEASKKAKGQGFFVKKSGDATIALIGFPNAGKSSLINVLTGTRSKVAGYAFTTLYVVPGMLQYRDAHIQVFDLPGLLFGAYEGKGRGSEVIAAAKSADLLLFVISVEDTAALDVLIKELERAEIKVNQERPEVQIIKSKSVKGIKIEVNKSGLNDKVIETVLNSVGIHDAEVRIWSKIDEDGLISLMLGQATYAKGIVALNKIDIAPDYQSIADDIRKRWNITVIPISVTNGTNIEPLKEAIYNELGLMRVYLKPELKSEESEPVTVPRGSSIEYIAKKLHTKLAGELKGAYVTGSSVKFARQKVGLDHVLQDGDIVTFIKY